MTRKELIYTLLRSEKAPQEDNYLDYLDKTTDSELKKRIKHVRVLIAKLGNILPKENKKKRKDEDITTSEMNCTSQKVKILQEQREKEQLLILLIQRDLEKEQKYHSSAHHDQTYYGIKDIEHLFNETIDDTTNQFQ